jgi:hypothetical protein
VIFRSLMIKGNREPTVNQGGIGINRKISFRSGDEILEWSTFIKLIAEFDPFIIKLSGSM